MADLPRDFSHLNTRPAENERLFKSEAIEDVINDVSERIADSDIRRMFRQCLPNTLDTTTYVREDAEGKPDTFIVTGDIPAMWLRDSTNQVWPYLRFARREAKLQSMLAGVVMRQVKSVNIDPYANAFVDPYVDNPPKTPHWPHGNEWHSGVWERKYELDSLAAFLRLSNGYYEATGDVQPFDSDWRRAVESTLRVIENEQATMTYANVDTIHRATMPNGEAFPASQLRGLGHPAKYTGMSRNMFRPSDDEAILPYHIPANAMTYVALGGLAKVLDVSGNSDLNIRVSKLAEKIDEGVKFHGNVYVPGHEKMYAYEVDGRGSQLLMDDPNVPSLLSLPYLGYGDKNSKLYRNTRDYILSDDNPYYARGKWSGLTSPHTGEMSHFWPIATIMQALTSDSDSEIRECLKTLKETHDGTYFVHESINVNDGSDYTRPWFGWANTLFGELILDLAERKPELLSEKF
ncbi:glycoside hydrolase family 125 protein [Candidatus Saccharibacteria bacterium]|nr:glycoside hydrolase family 125 protein [Candidatus Saccharibacteria bacterium]